MFELLPRGTPSDKLAKIRARVSYRNWRELLAVINDGDAKAILEKIHVLIDGMHGYGYASQAYYAQESLELVLKEEGLWNGE